MRLWNLYRDKLRVGWRNLAGSFFIEKRANVNIS